ncbi:MAG: hypothetical protein ACREAD_05855 [Nitrosopumilaceae archaeon]
MTGDMKDINKIMPKIPDMRWGALLNKYPTNDKVKQMNKIFPHNVKWHTVFEEDEQVFVDGVRIWKKDMNAWT